MKAVGIAAGVVAGTIALGWIGDRAWVPLVLGAVVLAALVLLIREILRNPNFVADSEEYERPGTTPEHVRDAGVVEGVILPEKRLPRG